MIELGPWGVLVRKFRGAYRPITAFYEFERKLGEAMGIGKVECKILARIKRCQKPCVLQEVSSLDIQEA